MTKPPQNRFVLTALVITVLAVIVRLQALWTQGDLLFDELFSMHYASMPLADSMSFILFDVHPPLFHLLLTGWIALFGDSVTAARLLSLLLSIPLVPLIGIIGRRVWNRQAAVIAMLFVALSPWVVYHSIEVRMYGLLPTTVALTTLLFMRFIEKSTVRRLVIWAVSAMVMLLIHLTAVLPFLVMVVYGLFLFRKRHMRVTGLFAASIMCAVPAALWLLCFLWDLWGRYADRFMIQAAVGKRAFGIVPAQFIVSGVSQSSAFIVSLVALLLMIFAVFEVSFDGKGFRIAPKKLTADIGLLVSLAVLPFVVLSPFPMRPIRYFFIALPAVVLLIAEGASRGISWVRSSWLGRLGVILACLCYLIIMLPNLLPFMIGPRVCWSEVGDFIEERERDGDVIVANDFFWLLVLGNYYDGEVPVRPLDEDRSSLPFDERLVRAAGYQTRSDDETREALERITADAQRVFFVREKVTSDRSLQFDWFFANGWIVVDEDIPDGHYSDAIVVFSRR